MRQVDPPGGPGDAVTVDRPAGRRTTARSRTLLEDKGVITNATVFQYYVKCQGRRAVPGRRLRRPAQRLVDGRRRRPARRPGPCRRRRRTSRIPEGLWLTDIRAKILETFPRDGPRPSSTPRWPPCARRLSPRTRPTSRASCSPATYEVAEGDEVDEQKLVRQMADEVRRGRRRASASTGPGSEASAYYALPGDHRGVDDRTGGRSCPRTGRRSPGSSTTASTRA